MKASDLHVQVTQSDLMAAFPKGVRPDAERVVDRLPPSLKDLPPIGRIPLLFNGEPITLPYRIYNQPPDEEETSLIRSTIVSCLYSRHHDGHQRAEAIAKAIISRRQFVVPFVVQLLGGYPIEIHRRIEDLVNDIWDGTTAEPFKAFASENPEYMKFTRDRATSYWNAYYRRRITDIEEYPAIRMLSHMDPKPD